MQGGAHASENRCYSPRAGAGTHSKNVGWRLIQPRRDRRGWVVLGPRPPRRPPEHRWLQCSCQCRHPGTQRRWEEQGSKLLEQLSSSQRHARLQGRSLRDHRGLSPMAESTTGLFCFCNQVGVRLLTRKSIQKSTRAECFFIYAPGISC